MGCVIDHEASERNPTHHPRWGMVPSLTSTAIGSMVVAGLTAASVAWLPTSVTWTLIVITFTGGVVSAAAQAFLGHRGACWCMRTVRWWLGPVGSLLDPFDAG